MNSFARSVHRSFISLIMTLPLKVCCQSYVTRSIRNWNDYMRHDLELLKEDALETIRKGLLDKNEFALAVGKRSLGTYLARTGKAERSLIYLEDASICFLKEGDQTLAAETLNELGNAYLILRRGSQAKKAYFSSIKAGLKASDPTSVFMAEINLAQAFLELKDTAQAIALIQDYKRKSAFHKKWEAVANSYAILGKIAQAQNKNDLSVEYFEKSAYFGLRSKAFLIRANALTNLAIVRYSNGDNKNAERLFLQALNLRKLSGEVKSQSESMFNLAVFYEENGKKNEAVSWYRSAINFAIQKQLSPELKDASLALSDLWEGQGNWSEAKRVLEELVEQQSILWLKNKDIENQEFRQLEGLQAFMENHPLELKKSSLTSETRPWIWSVVLILSVLLITAVALSAKRKR